MSFPAYSSYHVSGFEWIGEIPSGWCVRRFRFVFRESNEKIETDVIGPMLSVSGYRGIEIKEYDDENRRRLDGELVGYRIVRPGQLVVNTMWLNYAGLGVSAHEGHVSPAYRSYWINPRVDGRYVHHLMRSEVYVQGYTRLLTGIRPNSLQMSRDDLMDFPILLPPVEDQIAIAAFLDRETAKIDALVEEQRRLIELLEEKRQAVISHAVTKGFDPAVPMKHSGVEWLGDVPAHWDVRPLKRDLGYLTSGSRGWAEHYSDEGALFIRIGNLTRNSYGLDLSDIQRVAVPEGAEGARTSVRAGDLLFSITAFLGSVAIAPDLGEPAYVSQHVALARLTNEHLRAEWVALVTLSSLGKGYFAEQGYGGTKIQLSLGDVGGILLTVPPIHEQDMIIQCVREQLEAFDRLIREADAAILLLRERRAALISAAVTGKIDVRITAPQQAQAA